MADRSASPRQPGLIKRTWRRLTSPSARWSVLSLLLIGAVVGALAVIGTDVMVKVTGTEEFCGGACHSMKAFTLPEYRQSAHYANNSGVRASCSDCHVPHGYPEKLWYKAKAGVRDIVQETRGVIATAELYEKERWRLANSVWDEMKANDSANCRYCHLITPDTVAKQKARRRRCTRWCSRRRAPASTATRVWRTRSPRSPPRRRRRARCAERIASYGGAGVLPHAAALLDAIDWVTRAEGHGGSG